MKSIVPTLKTALLLLATLIAAPIEAGEGNVNARWPIALHRYMSRVNAVSWGLKIQANGLCPRTSPEIGIVLDYREAYDPSVWPTLTEATGMADLPLVIGVAPGSPAAQAGVAPGDSLAGFGSEPMKVFKARVSDLSLLGDGIVDNIARTPEGQQVALSLLRDGRALSLAVAPVRVCAGRTVVETKSGFNLRSDGRNVAIGTDTIASMHNDDELSLLLGHEYAHIYNQHEKTQRLKAVRRQEAQADLLGAALSRCAGFDVERGLEFWHRYKARAFGWLSVDPTHGSVNSRIERIRKSLPAIACPLSRYKDDPSAVGTVGWAGSRPPRLTYTPLGDVP